MLITVPLNTGSGDLCTMLWSTWTKYSELRHEWEKKRDQDHDHGQLCYIHHTSCFVYLRWPTKICNTIPRILPWFHLLCGISLSKHMLWFLCNSFSMLSENMNSGFYCWWKNSVILWMNTIVRYTSSNRWDTHHLIASRKLIFFLKKEIWRLKPAHKSLHTTRAHTRTERTT